MIAAWPERATDPAPADPWSERSTRPLETPDLGAPDKAPEDVNRAYAAP
jgi:hypothetical protein